MTTLRAWQHIYSNVEKEQSPRGRGGFQTLFYTLSELTEAEVEELEGRLLYFASAIEPVKRVFFTLSTGQRVVAQLVPLAEPDQFGRKGRYLAHSLVFPAKVFADLGEDPFPIFQLAPFMTSVAEALARGNFQTGDIPPLSLELPRQPDQTIQLAAAWAKQEWKKLSLLALQAERLAQDRRAVAFAGTPAEIEKALQAAFYTLPTPLRSQCSFDTYFYRCNLVATYYWAVGFPERPGNPTFDLVDAQSRQVVKITNDQPQTAYERWLFRAIEDDTLQTAASDRDVAFSLCCWLDGGANDDSLLADVPEQMIRPVFAANEAQARELLRQKIANLMPPVLVERVFGQIYDPSAPRQTFAHLRAGFDLLSLLDKLYQTYEAQDFRKPSTEEVKALGQIWQRVERHPLRLMQAAWSGRRQALQAELARSTETEYRQFLPIALRHHLTQPLNLLMPGRAPLFLEAYLNSDAAGEEKLNELAAALLKMNEPALLDRLAADLTRQPEPVVREIERLVKNRADIPPAFQEALAEATANLPEKAGLKRLVGTVTGPFRKFRRSR